MWLPEPVMLLLAKQDGDYLPKADNCRYYLVLVIWYASQVIKWEMESRTSFIAATSSFWNVIWKCRKTRQLNYDYNVHPSVRYPASSASVYPHLNLSGSWWVIHVLMLFFVQFPYLLIPQLCFLYDCSLDSLLFTYVMYPPLSIKK